MRPGPPFLFLLLFCVYFLLFFVVFVSLSCSVKFDSIVVAVLWGSSTSVASALSAVSAVAQSPNRKPWLEVDTLGVADRHTAANIASPLSTSVQLDQAYGYLFVSFTSCARTTTNFHNARSTATWL